MLLLGAWSWLSAASTEADAGTPGGSGLEPERAMPVTPSEERVVAPVAEAVIPVAPVADAVMPVAREVPHAPPVALRASEAFSARCSRTAERCFRRLGLGDPGVIGDSLGIQLSRTASGYVVAGVGAPSASVAVKQCLEEDLVGAAVDGPLADATAQTISCPVRWSATALLPYDLDLGDVFGRCVPVTGEVEVELHYVVDATSRFAVVRGVELVRPELDPYARRCVELGLERRIDVPGNLLEPRQSRESLRARVEPPVDTRRPPAPRVALSDEQRAVADELLDEALSIPREQIDERIEVLEACVEAAPSFAHCYVYLASSLASAAARDLDVGEMEDARWAYEQFVELAAPDDRLLPAVRDILAKAPPRYEPRAVAIVH